MAHSATFPQHLGRGRLLKCAGPLQHVMDHGPCREQRKSERDHAEAIAKHINRSDQDGRKEGFDHVHKATLCFGAPYFYPAV